MAKYISTDIINAAQWDPQETETMREFLAPLKSKVKKCSLVTNVTPSTLDQEGVLDVDTPSLVVDYSTGGAVTAKPTDYVVQYSSTKLKVYSAANFEKMYQLSPEADPDEIPATPAEKSALNELVTVASTAATTATVSEDGSDVAETDTWASLEDVNALKVAIFNAHITSHNPNATTAEVNEAIAVLTEAIDVFNASIKTGTGENVTPPQEPVEPATPDKTILTGAIAAATAAKIGATVSTDGSDVEPEDTWVSQDDVSDLEDAIAAAQAVVDNEEVDQDTIDAAIVTLNGAVQTFKSAAKAGTKTDPVEKDETNLRNQLTSAGEVISSASVSVNGSDIDPTDLWTTQSDFEALNAAIVLAQTVIDNDDATQAEIDEAAQALEEAISVFESTLQVGTKVSDPEDPTTVNKTALTTAISAAETIISDANVSEDGSDVDPTEQWVSREAVDALEDAIEVAVDVADNVDATAEDVSDAVDALNEAIAAFGTAKQNGTKVNEVNKSALNLAIANALSAKEGIEVSALNGTDIDIDKQWVTQANLDALNEAITDAQATVDNADATIDDIDAAITAVNGAIDTFNSAKKQGSYTGIEEAEVSLDD